MLAFRILAPAVALLALGPIAHAAPRVAVVVLSHDGLGDAQTDEIAYDVAAAVATRIEGEGIAGASVRELLPEGAPEGCEEKPQCGRELGAKAKTDEVLLLDMHAAGKTTVVRCLRVPRDPAKEQSDRTLRLLGAKPKREAATKETIEALYAPGSVTPFAEAPAPPPVLTPPPPVPEEKPELLPKVKQEEPPHGSRTLLWAGIGAGVGVAAVIAVVLGLTLGIERAPSGPTVTLP